jgi:hypothetical protein
MKVSKKAKTLDHHRLFTPPCLCQSCFPLTARPRKNYIPSPWHVSMKIF